MSLKVLWFLLLMPIACGYAEVGINIHGLSYHPDREDSNGRNFNELNPGFGIHWNARSTNKTILAVESGSYVNSFDDPAFYSSLAWKYRFTPVFSAGVAGSFFYSPSYHDGHPFFAPFPIATFRSGRNAFHILYFPRFKDFNRNAVFGLYYTLFRR